MITLSTSEIPIELKRLHTPPEKLYLSDNNLGELLAQPRLAVVGSRKVTAYGRAVTSNLSSSLASRGVVIVSGLALGVDSIAHSNCLQSKGKTIAVLPAGLDRIYPTSHHRLARDIVKNNGLLVSEYPPKTEPMRHNFIARNRIIAGLAEGLLITEAAVSSGSLHTARFALELGIPVFAVPGPITNPMSEGTNNLIKSGAIPVTSVEDILDEMGWQNIVATEDELSASSQEELVILKLIQSGVTDGAELLIRSNLEASKYNQTMTMLEITAKIRPLGTNQWSIS